jgi:hypothetical protein
MVRASKNRASKKNPKFHTRASIERVRGHVYYYDVAIVSGTSQYILGVHPLAFVSSRLALYADMYEGYRFNSLRVSFCKTNGDKNIGVAYRPMTAVAVAPTTFHQVSEIDRFIMDFPGNTVARSLTVTAPELKGEKLWYDCADVQDNCGALFVSVYDPATSLAVAQHFTIMIEWIVDFYGPVDPAVTMEKLRVKTITDTDDDEDIIPVIPPHHSKIVADVLSRRKH